jgi:hypothetical protein
MTDNLKLDLARATLTKTPKTGFRQPEASPQAAAIARVSTAMVGKPVK